MILVALVATLGACSKDYGTAETHAYAIIAPYHAIEISNDFDVVMSETDSVASVTLPEGLWNRLVFSVEDGTLKIGLVDRPLSFYGDYEARVVLPQVTQIDAVDISGASSFTSSQTLQASNIAIILSGASVFKCPVEAARTILTLSGASIFRGTVAARSLDAELSGSSYANLSGTASLMTIDVSGGSEVDAPTFNASRLTGEMSGGSTVDVNVCESVTVDLSGGSMLTYGLSDDSCNPTINCTTSGSSVVKPRRTGRQ